MEKDMTKTKAKEKKGRYFELMKKSNEPALDKILKAARKIFATHPFSSATTRMIAEEAGVDHSLIHYYFGLKENLFEATCERLFNEVNAANESWLEGLEKLPLKEGLSIYLDRLLDYAFDNPEPFQVIAINMVQAGSEDIPAYKYIIENIEFNKRIIEERFPQWKAFTITANFLNAFTMLMITFMGARTTIGKMHGIDPKSDEYRKWVKDSMYMIFLPLMKQGLG